MIDIKYKVINGTSYHEETPDEVCQVLETARLKSQRIRIVYGNVRSGTVWPDPKVRGRVGRSTGEVKIPLLVKTSRSSGGEGICDSAILRIEESPGGKVLYQWKQVGPTPPDGFVFGKEKTKEHISYRITWELWAEEEARRSGNWIIASGHVAARVSYENLLKEKFS